MHRFKTIAIISAVGHTFLFQHAGSGAFAWLKPPDSHFLEISDWNIDPMVVKLAATALARNFTIKQVAFEPADFSTWDYSLLRRAALDLNGDPNIDAYLLILRDRRADDLTYSAASLNGLGMLRQDGDARKFAVFASYRVVLVDALTGETVASRAVRLTDGTTPTLAADRTLWPKTQNDLTPAQTAAISADAQRLVRETLLPALAQMGLTR